MGISVKLIQFLYRKLKQSVNFGTDILFINAGFCILHNILFFFIRTSKGLMRLNILIFWRFSASKCSYFFLILLWNFLTCWRWKLLLRLIIISNWGYWGYRISLYCPWRVQSYISRQNIRLDHKRLLWQCLGNPFVSKFLREKWIIFILLFCTWTSQPQNVLTLFLLFLISPVVLIKFALF